MPRCFNIVFFLFSFFLSSDVAFAQMSSEDYLNLVRQEQQQNNNQIVLSLLNEAERLYPKDPNIFFERGSFYFNQRIYKNALKDFLLAQKYSYDNTYTLYTNIAEIYNIQGKYEKAKEYYDILIKDYPENEHVLANALWYYYKTLQIKEGIDIGEQIIQTWSSSSSINSMLALLYASLHNYEKAQGYYQRAVDISIQEGRYREASQTLYNQAIFEEEFYQFALSENLLQKAIELDNNPSSYRLMGELYLKKLLYWPAKEMIEISEDLEINETETIKRDRTPLGRLVLAQLYLTFNQLQMAEKILSQVDKLNNQEWITSFGTNKDAYLSWQYSLQAILWQKHYLILKRSIHNSWAEWIQQKLQMIRASFFYLYYKSLQNAFALKGANNMRHEQLLLPAYKDYLAISEEYPNAQRRFLDLSSALELPFAPKAKPTYLTQKALLEKNTAWRDEALQEFDPVYERYKKQVVLEKWLIQQPHTKDRLSLITQLYDLNRAAVAPFGLPVQLYIQGDEFYTKPLRKFLKQNLLLISNSLYILKITLNQGTAEIILEKDAHELIQRRIEFTASAKGIAELANRVLFYLYFPTE